MPSPQAAASGESCERLARSVKGRGRAGEVRSHSWVRKEDDGGTVYQFQKVSFRSEHP